MSLHVNWARDSPGMGEMSVGLDITNDNIRRCRNSLNSGHGRVDWTEVMLPYHLKHDSCCKSTVDVGCMALILSQALRSSIFPRRRRYSLTSTTTPHNRTKRQTESSITVSSNNFFSLGGLWWKWPHFITGPRSLFEWAAGFSNQLGHFLRTALSFLEARHRHDAE
mgnify:CR=1 FL=1